MAENFNGESQFFFFGEKPNNYIITYGDDVISVFNAMNHNHGDKFICLGGDRIYKVASKIDENGNTLKKGVYKYSLYYHKKYGKIDKRIKSVTFDVVGYKRKTTHLPAGVIINNVKFIF